MKAFTEMTKNRGLWVTFGLTFAFFLVEVVGGLATNSLTLLAHASHMLADVGGLGLALFAAWMSAKPATTGNNYAYYRVEIFTALASAAVLFLMSFYLLHEAGRRLEGPSEVQSLPMLAVATFGLVPKLVGIWLLRTSSKERLNLRAALLDGSALLSSIAVLVAGGIMWVTGWWYADPICSLVIGLYLLPRTWSLMTKAIDVLLEATPAHINLSKVEQAMLGVEGVASVHDLHVWRVASGIDALSAHVVLKDDVSPQVAAAAAKRTAMTLKEEFRIDLSTIQLEDSGHRSP